MAAERKRKRRSSALVLLNGVLTLLILAVVAGGGAIIYGLHLFYEAGPKTEDTAFLVERGSTLNSVTGDLVSQGFTQEGVLQPVVLRVADKLLGDRSKGLMPGQYLIPAKASMADILKIVTETKPQEFFINVVPGETSWEVAQNLNDPALNLTGDPISPPVEGTLLAVRHDFFPRDTRVSLVNDMEKAMDDKVAEIWAGHDHSIDDVIRSPHEMVVMASLVEKETGLAAERAQIASVFINRMRKHMRLQTDPSVMYGITLGKGKLDRGLTTADLKSKSPYNTYQVDGLPPGPIANPGVDALNAVAHPAGTNYLYFVAKGADPSDGHTFAATYAEHKKNVALYRQAVKDQATEDAKEQLEEQQAQDAGDSSQ